MYALLINTDGTVEEITLPDGDALTRDGLVTDAYAAAVADAMGADADTVGMELLTDPVGDKGGDAVLFVAYGPWVSDGWPLNATLSAIVADYNATGYQWNVRLARQMGLPPELFVGTAPDPAEYYGPAVIVGAEPHGPVSLPAGWAAHVRSLAVTPATV